MGEFMCKKRGNLEKRGSKLKNIYIMYDILYYVNMNLLNNTVIMYYCDIISRYIYTYIYTFEYFSFLSCCFFFIFKKFYWHIVDLLCCVSFCVYNKVHQLHTQPHSCRFFSHIGPCGVLSWVPWHHCFLFIFNWKPSFQFSNLITTHKQCSSSIDIPFFSLPWHMACGILVPQPAIKPRTVAVKARCPNHWTTSEFSSPIDSACTIPLFSFQFPLPSSLDSHYLSTRLLLTNISDSVPISSPNSQSG